MTTDITTHPGEAIAIGIAPLESGMLEPVFPACRTILLDFDTVSHLLSQKELRRPRAGSLSGAQLKQIARHNPPPPEWYEGEEERPF